MYQFNKNTNKLTKAQIKLMSVPKDLVKFYTINAITKIGKKINNNGYYALDQFIFQVKDNKINRVFYNLQFLRDNPSLLQ